MLEMRTLTTLVLLCNLFNAALAAVSCPAGPRPCRGVTGGIASAFKNYSPAQTFCSQRFPVPRQTCTSTAPCAKVTSTVATTVVTTTVATTTASITASPSTTTITNTNTPTITSTSTQTQTVIASATVTTTVTTTPNAKRHELTARAVDPRASQLSSLSRQAAWFAGAVCTCLETPVSTTVATTPTETIRATATSTSSVTASTAMTVTPTVSTTVTVTAPAITTYATITTITTSTTTFTSTSTSTAPAARATCSHAAGDYGTYCGSNVCYYAVESCYVYPEGDEACFNDCTGNCAFVGGSNQCVKYADDCCGGSNKFRVRALAGTTMHAVIDGEDAVFKSDNGRGRVFG